MPGKRAKVPAALHSELSEYSSLLRALRTSNALDLTSHIASYPLASSASNPDVERVVDESVILHEGESERTATNLGEGSSVQAEDVLSRLSSLGTVRKGAKQRAQRDTWTRWPLLAGDVYVPEWSLEDEVKALALRYLRPHPGQAETGHVVPSTSMHDAIIQDVSPDNESTKLQADSPVDDDTCLDDDDESFYNEEYAESLLTPLAVGSITASTGRYLSQLIALLAAYVPPGEKSMQNRVRPLNWESVLDIAAVNELVTSESLRDLRVRLSSIYPESLNTKAHRHDYGNSKLAKAPPHDFSFLTIDGYDPDIELPRPQPPALHKRSRRRPRSASAGDQAVNKKQKATSGT